MMWGILPVFLQICLQVMNSQTITWYRFAFASLLMLGWLLYTRAMPRVGSRSSVFLLLIASTALVINYVANVLGLTYISAEVAQILMQLAPFLLMLGGVFLFKEPFSRFEKLGAWILGAGLLLFFNQDLPKLLIFSGDYAKGVWIILLAAITWAIYALLQKVLLKTHTAKQLTLLMYAFGVLFLLPFTTPDSVFQMNTLQWSALLFCCLNTLVAYGTFTEALNQWQASKVSAVIALTPLFTFASMELAVLVWPEHFAPRTMSVMAYVGTALVVAGSMLTALGKAKSTSSKNHA